MRENAQILDNKFPKQISYDVNEILDTGFSCGPLFVYNLYGRDGNLSQLHFKCPHCGTASVVSYQNVDFFELSQYPRKAFSILASFICCDPNCGKQTIIMERFNLNNPYRDLRTFVSENKQDFWKKIIDTESTVLFPLKNQDYTIPFPHTEDSKYINERIFMDYLESQKLLAVSPKACSVFARKTLERIVLTVWPNVATEARHRAGQLPNLADMIDYVGTDNDVNAKLLKALKDFGNSSVHVLSAEEDIDISYEDALLALHLIDDLIIEYIIRPAQKSEREEQISTRVEEMKEKKKQVLQKQQVCISNSDEKNV